MYSRRDFLKHTPPLISLLAGLPAFAESNRSQKRVILLRSSWQTVNIGDIGHTPGVLRLLEEYLPQVEVRLWPVSVGHGVAEMLRRRFPKVAIIKTPDELKAAFTESDFLLHGSGASLVAHKDLKRWDEDTGKPYGIYGITFPGYYGKPSEAQKASVVADIKILNKARFVFFRDSVCLNFAKDHAVACPVMEFGPDGAFAVDVRNDEEEIAKILPAVLAMARHPAKAKKKALQAKAFVNKRQLETMDVLKKNLCKGIRPSF